MLSDLANDEAMVDNPNKLKFTEFLTGLSKKLEQITGSDLVRGTRTHSSSEDNICLSNKYSATKLASQQARKT